MYLFNRSQNSLAFFFYFDTCQVLVKLLKLSVCPHVCMMGKACLCACRLKSPGVSGDQKTASVVSSYIHSTIFEMGGVSFLFATL